MQAMAAEAQKLELLAKAGSDLRFLFDKEEVDVDVQVKFYGAGILSIKTFAALFKDAEDLRATLKANFELDPDASFAEKVRITKVVVAWEAAKTRATKAREIEGDAEARQQPKPVSVSDHKAMRQVFEKKWWELEDEETPAKTYMEKKLDEVEKSDLHAEGLEDVLSIPEDDGDAVKPVYDTAGILRAVKVAKKIPLPKNPEQLRHRLNLMNYGLMFAASAHTSRTYLQGITPQLAVNYAKYLLGEHVLGLASSGEMGAAVSGERWALILQYERQIRKKAVKLTDTGETWVKALKMAMDDPVVKERYFTTPLGIVAKKESEGAVPPPPMNFDGPSSGKRANDGQQGNGQRLSKKQRKFEAQRLKAAPAGRGLASETPNKEKLCYAYNNPREKCRAKKCKFAHRCRKCFGDHPQYDPTCPS